MSQNCEISDSAGEVGETSADKRVAALSGRIDDDGGGIQEARPVREVEVGLHAARMQERRDVDVMRRVDAELGRKGRKRVRLVCVGCICNRSKTALHAAAHILEHPLEERAVAEEAPHLEFGRDIRRAVAYLRVRNDLRARKPHPLRDTLRRHHGAAQGAGPELDRIRRAGEKPSEIDEALKAGTPFSDLAREHSADAKAKEGGQWKDVRPEDVFRPEICEEIAKMPKGTISKWIELDGWKFLLRKDDERGGGKMSFADAYDVIAANVKNEEAKRIYTDWIERLKKETFIKVY